ncbi:Na+/H+ antiporter subunit A [Bacillus kwashiorkori]|uniref:Na+/H+ antiporter subunit A n=1 Tax=Bacillus kwashiorkori TaxID=1522318 RepID=UPI0007848F6A|nr:Na+/H+ antiporter subunit A [Bacillus kwashiorkori]
MSALHFAIISPFIFAIFVPFLYKLFRKIHTGWFVLLLPSILFIYFLQFISVTRDGDTFIRTVSWIPSLHIDFIAKVDGLSLIFALLITGIGALVVLYSIYYLSKNKEKLNTFYVYLLLFMGAMLGVVLSDNLIVLYMFWEFTSFSSFFLIGYWHEREKSRYGAQKSMLITVFGGLSLLGGIILLYIMTGTFSIQEMVANVGVITGHALFIPAMIFVLLGAFTKSAQFPFHIWLPDAMEAPTPVSAYLHSATMVKAGIYLVARMTPIFAYDQSGTWIWLVAGFGIITLFWGSFNAVKQTDLKAILAFSTISQLGLIMSLLGVGAAALHFNELSENIYTMAIVAAVFHLINHSTFKGSLFMMAGIVDHETGTRDIRKLGGLMTLMPITFTIALIGTFSMAGIPPFNGFLSKEMFFTAMKHIASFDLFNFSSLGILFPIIAWIASVFTFIYSMMLVWKTFTGPYKPEKLAKKPHEAPIGMLISPIILVSLVIIIGLFPNILSATVLPAAANAIMPEFIFDVHIKMWHGVNLELFMTIGVIAIGTLLYLSLSKWSRVYSLFPEKLTLNKLYDAFIPSLESSSNVFIRSHMTGYIRAYLAYIFIFFIGILGITIWGKDAFVLNTENTASIGVYEAILALLIVIGTVTILASKSRLTSILALGAVGYTVSLYYILFRAPDLALTQLVIETISVALFLVCFYFLPKKFHLEKTRFKLTNAIISIGVGLVVTLIAIASSSTKLFPSISKYYEEHTYDPAGGENMVNVILVDFRGFDTLFEICVLAVAGLGIYSLIKLRMTRRKEG